MKSSIAIQTLLCLALFSCNRDDSARGEASANQSMTGGIEQLDAKELVGEWVCTYCNGDPGQHGRSWTFEQSGELSASGGGLPPDRGHRKNYWHIVYLKSGEAVLLMEGTNTNPQALSKIAEFDGDPFVVSIEGEEMKWCAFGREELVRAAPTDLALYRFKKAEPHN